MTDQTVIAEQGQYRVVAKMDECPNQPEWQGYPSVILSHARHGGMTESWKGAVDMDAIQRALNELDDEVFDRWAKIFGSDLVNWKEAGLSEDDPEAEIHVLHATGYSQGDYWTLLTWMPKGSEAPDADEDELVNWARGDAYYLELQKKVTWTTDDPDFEDQEEWEEVDTVWGFNVQWPEKSEWLKEAAKDMIPEQN